MKIFLFGSPILQAYQFSEKIAQLADLHHVGPSKIRELNNILLDRNDYNDFSYPVIFPENIKSQQSERNFTTSAYTFFRSYLSENSNEKGYLFCDPLYAVSLNNWLGIFSGAKACCLLDHPLCWAIFLRKSSGIPISVGIALWECYTKSSLSNKSDQVAYLYLPDLLRSQINVLKDFLAIDSVRMEKIVSFLDACYSSLSAESNRYSLDELLTPAQADLHQKIINNNFDVEPNISSLSRNILENYERSQNEKSHFHQKLATEKESIFLEKTKLYQHINLRQKELQRMDKWLKTISEHYQSWEKMGKLKKIRKIFRKKNKEEVRVHGKLEEYHLWKKKQDERSFNGNISWSVDQSIDAKIRPSSPSVEIVICIHNALAYLQKCLESLERSGTKLISRVILVNDGSREEVGRFIHQWAQSSEIPTKIISNEFPGGFCKAANQGMKASQAEYVILLNSDVVVTTQWLERMLQCGESDSKIGIIGPLSNSAYAQSVPLRFDYDGGEIINRIPENIDIDKLIYQYRFHHSAQYPLVKLVCGFCFVIKRRLIDSIGLFDEDSFPNGYGEETDYCLRANQAGFECRICDDVYITHATTKSYTSEQKRALIEKSQKLLEKKHGEVYQQSNRQAIDSPGLENCRRDFATALKKYAEGPGILFLVSGDSDLDDSQEIVQLAYAISQQGWCAQIAVSEEHLNSYQKRYEYYPSCLFISFKSKSDLVETAKRYDVGVASNSCAIPLLKHLCNLLTNFRAVYFLEEYELLFYRPGEKRYLEIESLYRSIPNVLAMSESQWICDQMKQKHNIDTRKIDLILEDNIFYNRKIDSKNKVHRIVAMVNPNKLKFSPQLTYDILCQLNSSYQGIAEIAFWGVNETDPFFCDKGIPEGISILGELSTPEVAEVLRGATIFLDLAQFHCSGRKVLEAMACNTASVVTHSEKSNEYAKDEWNCLFVDVSDSNAILNSVDRLIKDDALFSKITANGLKTAESYCLKKAAISALDCLKSEEMTASIN